VIAISAGAATVAAQPQDSQSKSQEGLQEVTVTATRFPDHRALERAVSGFVASHAAPGARTNQLGRWHQDVCPLVTGLRPVFDDFVTREVINVARDVGAPVRPAGKKCSVNERGDRFYP
jgi:hypothetical protein